VIWDFKFSRDLFMLLCKKDGNRYSSFPELLIILINLSLHEKQDVEPMHFDEITIIGWD
jgi:hypothetical protein